jgi:transposase
VVAALVDEIGLVELTDELLPPHALNHISPGQVVKAMILNGLGFVSAPLYLVSAFFEGKPVEHLLGAGIKAAHLNDDRLGRVLDQLFEYGTTLFFLKAAMQAVSRFGVSVSQCHLDSTSFALDGEYPTVAEPEGASEAEAPQTIEICRGYSRDHRPELKQFLVNLICSADGGIPVWFKVGSGNETDSQTFAGLMQAFAEQWQMPALMVADAAFYSEPNLQAVGSLPWLSRVPQTLKAAQTLVDSALDPLTEMPCDLDGYRLWEQRQSYGGVGQRWILVESPHRTQSEDWLKPLEKQEKGLQRSLRQLCSQVFACKPDAMDALLHFQDSLTGYTLTQVALVSVAAKCPPVGPSALNPQTHRLWAINGRPPWSARLSTKPSANSAIVASFWPPMSWMTILIQPSVCCASTKPSSTSSAAFVSSKTPSSLPAVSLSKSLNGSRPWPSSWP